MIRSALRGLTATALTVALAVAAASCGGDDAELSEAGERGKRVSTSNGCASCHGSRGQGGAGPAWVNLFGAERELTDGTIVIADEDYLYRSIADPAAERLAGWNLRMPANRLSDDQIADVIAYIRDLSPDATTP